MHVSARNTCKKISKSSVTPFFHFSVAFGVAPLILAADSSEQRQSNTVLLDGLQRRNGE